MQQWEYLYIVVSADYWKQESGEAHHFNYKKGITRTALLNSLGDQGWELVSINHENEDELLYTFKRPKQ